MTVRTHAGDLPWSGPTSLNAISVMHDVDLEGSNFVASPTSSTPPSFLPSGGGVRAAGTAGGAVPGDSPMAEEAAAAAAGVGFGEGAQRPRSGAGARSMYLGSDGKRYFLVRFFFQFLVNRSLLTNRKLPALYFWLVTRNPTACTSTYK